MDTGRDRLLFGTCYGKRDIGCADDDSLHADDASTSQRETESAQGIATGKGAALGGGLACHREPVQTSPVLTRLLRIRILRQALHAGGQLLNSWLTVDSGRIEGGMPQQCCQPNNISRILCQIVACECMPERMSTRVDRQEPTNCRIPDDDINHLAH